MLMSRFSEPGGRSRDVPSATSARAASRWVVLAHRVPLERLVGQDADEVRVALEDDPVEVPDLALEPVAPLKTPVSVGTFGRPRAQGS